jgi:hypothetical protein
MKRLSTSSRRDIAASRSSAYCAIGSGFCVARGVAGDVAALADETDDGIGAVVGAIQPVSARATIENAATARAERSLMSRSYPVEGEWALKNCRAIREPCQAREILRRKPKVLRCVRDDGSQSRCVCAVAFENVDPRGSLPRFFEPSNDESLVVAHCVDGPATRQETTDALPAEGKLAVFPPVSADRVDLIAIGPRVGNVFDQHERFLAQ